MRGGSPARLGVVDRPDGLADQRNQRWRSIRTEIVEVLKACFQSVALLRLYLRVPRTTSYTSTPPALHAKSTELRKHKVIPILFGPHTCEATEQAIARSNLVTIS